MKIHALRLASAHATVRIEPVIDLAIVIGYLVATLAVGLGQGKQIDSVHDFALGNRHVSTATLVATLFATGIGGVSTMGVSERVFSVGIVFLFVFWGEPVNNLIAGRFLAPRMQRFAGAISVGDMMHRLYGKPGQLVTGIAGTLKCTGFLGGQISATGYLLQELLGWPQQVSILVGCSVVILYSGLGGMRAVTITDVLQFSILMLTIPLLLLASVHRAGGWEHLFAAVPKSHLTVPPPGESMSPYLALLGVMSIPFFTPPVTQRLLMAKDGRQAEQSLLGTAILGFPFFLMCALIGLAALVLAKNLDARLAMPHLARAILPSGIKGCAVVGLLAVIMSTADSFLHSASIALVHDVVRPLWPTDMPDRLELRLTRAATFVLGYGAVFFALLYPTLVDILFAAFHFWGPVVLPPLIAGIWGVRASTTAFVAAAVAGTAATLAWGFWIEPALHVSALVPGMAANTAVFWGVRAFGPKAC